jgi:hypothetical protein
VTYVDHIVPFYTGGEFIAQLVEGLCFHLAGPVLHNMEFRVKRKAVKESDME